MGHTAATVWECRSGGALTNGGGYDSTYGGTDYSQQDAAQESYTTLACTAAAPTTLTCSGGDTFNANIAGNIIYIASGTNFVAGWYLVTAYTSSTQVTLYDSPISGGDGSSGAGNMGGAVTLNGAPDTWINQLIAGQKTYIKADATHTVTTDVSLLTDGGNSTPIVFECYNTTRGDAPTLTDRPLIAVNANIGFRFDNNVRLYHARVTMSHPTGLRGDNNAVFYNVSVNNSYATACAAFASGGSGAKWINCEGQAANGTAFDFTASGAGGAVLHCYAHDSAVGLDLGAQNYVAVVGNIIDTCTDGIDIGTGVGHVIDLNVIYGPTNDGIIGSTAYNITVINNIFDDHAWHVKLDKSDVIDPSLLFEYNCYDDGTSGSMSWDNGVSEDNTARGANAVVADPLLTAPATGDFTLGSGSPCIATAMDLSNAGATGSYKLNMGVDQDDVTASGGADATDGCRDLGDRDEDSIMDFTFQTKSAGAGATLTGGTISVYKANGTTQSVAGVTLTTDFDALTGLNHVRIDTSADVFYAQGNDYSVVITTGTVGGVSVVGATLATFSIEQRYKGHDLGAIWIDTNAGSNGNGSAVHPCNSIANANAAATKRGTNRFVVAANSSITLAATQSNQIFSGSGYSIALGTQTITGSTFSGGTISGVSDGSAAGFSDCTFPGVTLDGTSISRSAMTGTLTLAAAGNLSLLNCFVPANSNFILDASAPGAATEIILDGLQGDVTLSNLDANCTVKVTGGAGAITLSLGSTGGTVRTEGSWTVTDGTSGAVTVTDDVRHGIGWDKVGSPTSTVGLTNTTVGTVTANTDMRGTDSAALASVATEGRLAELDAANLPAVIDTIDGRLPAALVAGRMSADAEAVGGSTVAAARLALSAAQLIPGTVDTVTNGHTPTTTEFQADDITEASEDHYHDRIVLFTSGALTGQVAEIDSYELVGGIGQFTLKAASALTEAPANDVTFLVV